MKKRMVLGVTFAGLAQLAGAMCVPAWAGTGDGGGGDAATEMRIDEIRSDILKWITEGGARELRLPLPMTYETYQTSMTQSLAPHAVVVTAVTTLQENTATDPELRVYVDGSPKTCRGFVSVRDSLPHILCNVERFGATAQADQYRLIHHEYAGLAGIEQNLGASSDYVISDQITDFLVPETRLRLAVKRRVPVGPPMIGAGSDIVCEFKDPDWRAHGDVTSSIRIQHRPKSVVGGLTHGLIGRSFGTSWGQVSVARDATRSWYTYLFRVTHKERVSCDPNGSGGKDQPVYLSGDDTFWSNLTCPSSLRDNVDFTLELNVQDPSHSTLSIKSTSTFSGGLSAIGPYSQSVVTEKAEASCVIAPGVK